MFAKYILSIILTIVVIDVVANNDSAFAQAARQRDATVVAVNELTDVEGDEWAYEAVQGLVEKYDALEGYPDSSFRGKRKATRFELAAATYDLATYFSDEIALDREDLAKLAKLLDEFSGEVKTIQGRVDNLETQVAGLETKTTALEGKVDEHSTKLDEHEKRLAYAERRKGFILERMIKGVIVDVRDLSRGIFASIAAPFNKDINAAISK